MQPEPIGSRELARQLELDPTRVNRLLKTLAHLGLTEQDSRRKYRAGPAIHILAAQSLFGSGLHDRAIGPLESLRELGYFVALGVLWRDQTCYLYSAPADTAVAPALAPPRPATSSAVGMALLAQRSDAEIRALYAEVGRTRRPEQQPAEPPVLAGTDGLLARLEQIRTQGYAIVGPRASRSVSTSVGDPPYAAIGLAGEISHREVRKLVAALHETARQISSHQGSRGKPLRNPERAAGISLRDLTG
jgi:DNA-binding IclR family transcriptional regulator